MDDLEKVPDGRDLLVAAPSRPLRDFVCHYWLGLDNPDSAYPVFPDGSVDFVLETDACSAHGWLFGTTTKRTEVPLRRRSHYLGVRFKPGQSRHFVNAAAHELTDGRVSSEHLLSFSLADLPERVPHPEIFSRLNELLERHLAGRRADRGRIDNAIEVIERSGGAGRIQDAVDAYGKSARHFERVFLQTVGVSAKRFASIVRFRRAAALLSRPAATLADIAYESGYSDQSHMTHEFTRLADTTPAAYARTHVGFLQDGTSPVF